MRLLSGQTQNPNQPKPEAKPKRSRRDDAEAIPPELLVRRDHNIRYERNGTVYATDGRVGQLRRVVVDDSAGIVSELVILVDGSDREVLLTPDLVDKTAGTAVFLTINRVQFNERSLNAPVYDKRQFARVDVKTLPKAADGGQARRSIAAAGRDFVETPNASPLARLQRPASTMAAD